MHGAYIFTETIWQVDRKVREHAAKVGSQRHFARFPHTYQSALLHPRTISGLPWVDFLRAGAGGCVCSCVFSWPEKGPYYPEGSTSCLLSGTFYQGRSVGGRYRLGTQLQTQRL